MSRWCAVRYEYRHHAGGRGNPVVQVVLTDSDSEEPPRAQSSCPSVVSNPQSGYYVMLC